VLPKPPIARFRRKERTGKGRERRRGLNRKGRGWEGKGRERRGCPVSKIYLKVLTFAASKHRQKYDTRGKLWLDVVTHQWLIPATSR